MAKGGLSSTGRADDCCGGVLRNMDGYPINDLSLVIGKLCVFHIDVIAGGNDILSVNVHRGHIQHRLRLAHIQIHIAQQSGIVARRVQRTKQDERRKDHDHSIQQFHRSVQVKCHGYNGHHHAEELGRKVLQKHNGYKSHFSLGIRRAVFINGFIQSPALFPCQIVGLNLCNALNILQHLFHQLAVRGILERCNRFGFLLEQRVDGKVQQYTQNGDAADSQVKKKDHKDYEDGCQDSLRHHHDHTGRHIRQRFHTVSGN